MPNLRKQSPINKAIHLEKRWQRKRTENQKSPHPKNRCTRRRKKKLIKSENNENEISVVDKWTCNSSGYLLTARKEDRMDAHSVEVAAENAEADEVVRKRVMHLVCVESRPF